MSGLGTYPHVAYNEFLLRLSNRLNAAIITAPYPVGLDHDQLAQRNGQLLERSVQHCQRDLSRQYPSTIPLFSLAHSLGSKLSCIHSLSSNSNNKLPYQAHGYISFNNFGFDQTFKMAKKFGETFRLNTGLSRNMEHEMLVDGFFTVAEQLVRVSHMEFRPSPAQTLSRLRYQTTSTNTRLFTFDSDRMDSSRDFVEASPQPVAVSSLPGTHLTPVFFQLNEASFGNQDDLEALVNEVCWWVHGEEPSRVPTWMQHETAARQRRPMVNVR